MTRRITSQNFPSAPPEWSPSSQAVWNRLIQTLENSDLFDKGRRTRPQFVVTGSVSAPVTLDVSAPDLTTLTNVVAKLLLALQGNNSLDVR